MRQAELGIGRERLGEMVLRIRAVFQIRQDRAVVARRGFHGRRRDREPVRVLAHDDCSEAFRPEHISTNRYPPSDQVGSWVVGGVPCGLSVREDASPITKNTSRFLPHAIID